MKLVLALCPCTVLALDRIPMSRAIRLADVRRVHITNPIATANITEYVAMQASNVAPR